jgi:ABC-type arginine/histidine transport system permease subunit
MIAVRDLTKVADGIKGRTFEAAPLFIAAVNLSTCSSMRMTRGAKKLEGRLWKGDRR